MYLDPKNFEHIVATAHLASHIGGTVGRLELYLVADGPNVSYVTKHNGKDLYRGTSAIDAAQKYNNTLAKCDKDSKDQKINKALLEKDLKDIVRQYSN